MQDMAREEVNDRRDVKRYSSASLMNTDRDRCNMTLVSTQNYLVAHQQPTRTRIIDSLALLKRNLWNMVGGLSTQ